jgi:hypothetical protein
LLEEITIDIDSIEEKALFTIQFKSECRNCSKMGHKTKYCKARRDYQHRLETQVICNYCKKPGHYDSECFKLLRKNQNLGSYKQRNEVASDTRGIVFSAINSHESFKNIWIGDSGASCHYCKSDKGMFDQTTISEMIRVGHGSSMKVEKVGTLRSCIIQLNGRKLEITFQKC